MIAHMTWSLHGSAVLAEVEPCHTQVRYTRDDTCCYCSFVLWRETFQINLKICVRVKFFGILDMAQPSIGLHRW